MKDIALLVLAVAAGAGAFWAGETVQSRRDQVQIQTLRQQDAYHRSVAQRSLQLLNKAGVQWPLREESRK